MTLSSQHSNQLPAQIIQQVFINAIIFQSTSILCPCYKYVNRVSITLHQAFLMVANLKTKIEMAPGSWIYNVGYMYDLFENVPTVVLYLENVGQDTTLVLLVQPQSLIFDKSCIFIDGQFKKIIKRSTGSKNKDYINLKTSPLDFWNIYIWTPNWPNNTPIVFLDLENIGLDGQICLSVMIAN